MIKMLVAVLVAGLFPPDLEASNDPPLAREGLKIKLKYVQQFTAGGASNWYVGVYFWAYVNTANRDDFRWVLRLYRKDKVGGKTKLVKLREFEGKDHMPKMVKGNTSIGFSVPLDEAKKLGKVWIRLYRYAKKKGKGLAALGATSKSNLVHVDVANNSGPATKW